MIYKPPGDAVIISSIFLATSRSLSFPYHSVIYLPTYLKTDIITRLINHLPGLLELLDGSGDKRLATKSRVDRHEQNDVNLIKAVLGIV